MTPSTWLVVLIVSLPVIQGDELHPDKQLSMFKHVTKQLSNYMEENLISLTSLEHHTVFQKVGTMASDLAFGHINVPLTIDHLTIREEIIKNFNQQLQNTTIPKKMKNSRRYHVKWLQNWSNQTATDILKYVDSMMNTFETDLDSLEDGEKNRIKRQVIAAVLGGIVASLVTMFSQSTLEDVVTKKQNVIAAQVQDNLIHINQNAHDVIYLNKTLNEVLIHLYYMEEEENSEHTATMILQSTYALGALAAQTEKILKAIEVVKTGRFSTDLATPEGLENAIVELKREALKSGRTIAVSNLLDLSLLPASYLYNATSRVFHAIVHVPFATPHDEMDLYKYVPTPIQIAQDSKLYASITNQDNMYLAVSGDGTTYKTFSVRDIQECTKFQNKFYCPNSIEYKSIRPSCLVSLHKNNITEIRSFCDLSIHNHISDAIRLDESTYILIETDPTELTVRCDHGYYKNQMIQGVVRIGMKPGCTAFTRYLTFKHPRFEPSVTTGEVLLNSRIDVRQWFERDVPITTYLDVARELIGEVGRSVPLKDIHHLAKFRHELASIKGQTSWPSFFTKLFPGGLISQIITYIVLVAFMYVCYKLLACYCDRRSQRVAEPPNYQQAMEMQPQPQHQFNASNEPLNIVAPEPQPEPNVNSQFWRAVAQHINRNRN